jgi:hypothetical protein
MYNKLIFHVSTANKSASWENYVKTQLEKFCLIVFNSLLKKKSLLTFRHK